MILASLPFPAVGAEDAQQPGRIGVSPALSLTPEQASYLPWAPPSFQVFTALPI